MLSRTNVTLSLKRIAFSDVLVIVVVLMAALVVVYNVQLFHRAENKTPLTAYVNVSQPFTLGSGTLTK